MVMNQKLLIFYSLQITVKLELKKKISENLEQEIK